MRSYERNGVTVDQCADCRGLFLDRGELERLVDAENAFEAAPPQREYQYGGHTHKKRKKHFLEELFD
jgi:hypothetical protein